MKNLLSKILDAFNLFSFFGLPITYTVIWQINKPTGTPFKKINVLCSYSSEQFKDGTSKANRQKAMQKYLSLLAVSNLASVTVYKGISKTVEHVTRPRPNLLDIHETLGEVPDDDFTQYTDMYGVDIEDGSEVNVFIEPYGDDVAPIYSGIVTTCNKLGILTITAQIDQDKTETRKAHASQVVCL